MREYIFGVCEPMRVMSCGAVGWDRATVLPCSEDGFVEFYDWLVAEFSPVVVCGSKFEDLEMPVHCRFGGERGVGVGVMDGERCYDVIFDGITLEDLKRGIVEFKMVRKVFIRRGLWRKDDGGYSIKLGFMYE